MPKIISRVTKATTKGEYLRTSIPQEIKNYLDLNIGDVIEWIPGKRNGKRVVILKKLE